MFLDLLIRSSGVGGSPAEHLSALASRYEGATIILYSPDLGGTMDLPSGCQVVHDAELLTQALGNAGNGQVVVYGGDGLLAAARNMHISTIWVALKGGTHDVREVWRVRQQHSWVSSKRLSLLVEQLPGDDEPDLKHLMRLTRASEAVLVPMANSDRLVDEVAAAFPAAPEVEQAMADAAVAVSAPPVESGHEASADEPEQPILSEDELSAILHEAEAAGEIGLSDKEAAAALAEAMANLPTEGEESTGFEPLAAIVAAAPANSNDYTPSPAGEAEGADQTVENQTSATFAPENPASQAEQALLRRYSLVKDGRTTSARIVEVKESLDNLLKEIFVSRFATGVEAAESFEALSAKLAQTSAEYTQLTKSLIHIEAELAKLAWLKAELEI